MDYTLLGKRIREERSRLHLTQEKLAESVNISTAYLGQIERGERNVRLDKLIAIARTLGVTVDFLLSDYVSDSDESYMNQLRQIFHEKTPAQKDMAINMVKLLFSYTNGKI